MGVDVNILNDGQTKGNGEIYTAYHNDCIYCILVLYKLKD